MKKIPAVFAVLVFGSCFHATSIVQNPVFGRQIEDPGTEPFLESEKTQSVRNFNYLYFPLRNRVVLAFVFEHDERRDKFLKLWSEHTEAFKRNPSFDQAKRSVNYLEEILSADEYARSSLVLNGHRHGLPKSYRSFLYDSKSEEIMDVFSVELGISGQEMREYIEASYGRALVAVAKEMALVEAREIFEIKRLTLTLNKDRLVELKSGFPIHKSKRTRLEQLMTQLSIVEMSVGALADSKFDGLDLDANQKREFKRLKAALRVLDEERRDGFESLFKTFNPQQKKVFFEIIGLPRISWLSSYQNIAEEYLDPPVKPAPKSGKNDDE